MNEEIQFSSVGICAWHDKHACEVTYLLCLQKVKKTHTHALTDGHSHLIQMLIPYNSTLNYWIIDFIFHQTN